MRVLHSRSVFISILVSGMSKIKVTAVSVPSEGSLPGLHISAFGFSSVHLWERGRETERDRETEKEILPLFMEPLIQYEDPTTMNSSNPNYLPKTSSPNVVALMTMATHMNFQQDKKYWLIKCSTFIINILGFLM